MENIKDYQHAVTCIAISVKKKNRQTYLNHTTGLVYTLYVYKHP